jgi:uncharacterized membrane protein YedE/YeeE
MKLLAELAAGLVFGLGLVVSGMVDPARVLNFLDLAGAWDPSLAFVMAGAVAVTLVGYRVALAQPRPVLAPQFPPRLPQPIDRRTLVGAAVFGVGWGLGGFCPGPAVTSLGMAAQGAFVFVAAMVAGMLAARLLAAAAGAKADPATT